MNIPDEFEFTVSRSSLPINKAKRVPNSYWFTIEWHPDYSKQNKITWKECTEDEIKSFVSEEDGWIILGSVEETKQVCETKHSHYKKDVSHLQFIDVYRVLELYNVTSPCIQHAIKKLLVAGGRGAGKDVAQDIQEAIDSLVRWQAMRSEDLQSTIVQEEDKQ